MELFIIQKFINCSYVGLKSNVHTSASKRNPRAGTAVKVLCLVAFATTSELKLWETGHQVYHTALFLLVLQVLFYTCRHNLRNYRQKNTLGYQTFRSWWVELVIFLVFQT